MKFLAAGALAAPVAALATDSVTAAAGAEDAPGATKRIFDVSEFGAIGDGQSLCTAAIQRAVDACARLGGGKVLVPPGRFLSGPIFLKSNLELEVSAGATLLGMPNIDEYPTIQGRWEGIDRTIYASLLTGEDLENVSITGRGVLDGNGQVWWDAAWKTEAMRNKLGLTEREPDNPPAAPLKWPRPRVINLYRCKNVRISGLTLLNSPSWHVHPVLCEDVCMDQLTILTPDHTPNTDGIDPDSCKNVRIANCYISTGDDGIVIKSGYRYKQGNPNVPSENIVITNCIFGHGWAGVGIGSETAGGVRNVTISNCVCDGARRGLNFKTARGRGNVVENIRVANFVVRNVDTGVLISMFYDAEDSHPAAPVTEATPTFRNLHLNNVTVSAARSAVLVLGLPENPIENLSLTSLMLESVTNGISCSNTRGLAVESVIVNAENAPALALTNLRDVEVTRFCAQKPNLQLPDLRLERVENAIIQSCTAVAGSRTLVEVKGTENRGITLALNRVPKGVDEVAFTGGASQADVDRRA
jgi:polygalacturonase